MKKKKSVITKKGDKGMTSLAWGKRVSKDDERIDAYGALDELCSHLALVKCAVRRKKDKEIIAAIQRDLFAIGSEIATEKINLHKLKKRIGRKDVGRLENAADALERERTFEVHCFYLPGENALSARTDLARTVARRSERQVVALQRKGRIRNAHILEYLNRLSDLLFLMARAYGKGKNVKL